MSLLQEHLKMIGSDGRFHYQSSNIDVAFVPPKTPLEKYLFDRLADAFERNVDRVTVTSAGKFPPEAVAAFEFTDDPWQERRPGHLYGRHEKPRGHKKAIMIGRTDRIPTEIIGDNERLSRWMRRFQALNAIHDALMVEGKSQERALHPGNRAVVSSMEGNVGVETYDDHREHEFFDSIVQRLKLLCGACMINQKAGRRSDRLTLEDWAQREVVQGIAHASRLLGETGFLWDMDLTDLGVSRIQRETILFTLKQAGLGEGQLSGMDRELGVMAVTETGVSKTHIDPLKGEVVPLVAIGEYGTEHWILPGLPKGHPFTLFQGISLDRLRKVGEFTVSTARRGRVRQFLKDVITSRGRLWVDHPSSIEGNENARFYRLGAEIHAGNTQTYGDFLEHLNEDLRRSNVVPIIPDGLEAGPNAAVHIHKTARDGQSDSGVKIITPDMADLGFCHSPPCGSLEAAHVVLSGAVDSYERYGMPESADEIRGVNLPGHGIFLWGYQGPRRLAQGIVSRVEFEPHVSRF